MLYYVLLSQINNKCLLPGLIIIQNKKRHTYQLYSSFEIFIASVLEYVSLSVCDKKLSIPRTMKMRWVHYILDQ